MCVNLFHYLIIIFTFRYFAGSFTLNVFINLFFFFYFLLCSALSSTLSLIFLTNRNSFFSFTPFRYVAFHVLLLHPFSVVLISPESNAPRNSSHQISINIHLFIRSDTIKCISCMHFVCIMRFAFAFLRKKCCHVNAIFISSD